MTTVRVVCPSHAPRDCETCGGLGYLDARLVAEVKMPRTTCCDAPWVTHPDGEWTCAVCGKVWKRKEIVGW